MDIKTQVEINAPVDQVWRIVGEHFADVSRWASAVHSSEARTVPDTPVGAPCGGRVCETSMGRFEETLVEFDDVRRTLGYTAQGDKMPFFVKHLQNNWKLHEVNNRTRVETHMQMSLLPVFAQLMGPMMRKQMAQVLGETLEELAGLRRELRRIGGGGHDPSARHSPPCAVPGRVRWLV